MKRTRSTAGGKLYNATTDLERIETKLYELCLLAGVDGSDLDAVTIDDIINGLRTNFRYTTPVAVAAEPGAVDWLRQANFHLVITARKYWWYRQLAKGAMTRG